MLHEIVNATGGSVPERLPGATGRTSLHDAAPGQGGDSITSLARCLQATVALQGVCQCQHWTQLVAWHDRRQLARVARVAP